MMNRDCNADDEIIGRIDAGRLHSLSHQVARTLVEHIQNFSDQDQALIAAFDGNVLVSQAWRGSLWSKIQALPVKEQGRLWLLWQLIRPNEQVGWELAEYMIAWARDEGVSEEEICSAFGVEL